MLAGSAEQRAEAYAALLPLARTHVVVGGCAAYAGPVDAKAAYRARLAELDSESMARGE